MPPRGSYMRYLAFGVWLLIWCASADAQPAVAATAAGGGSPANVAVSPSRLPEYHSPSEVWLPFFQAAVDRFQREKAPSQTAMTSLREAQASIASVNQLASYLVAKTLQEDVLGYFVLLEASDRAGKRAEKAAADLRETTLSEEKY